MYTKNLFYFLLSGPLEIHRSESMKPIFWLGSGLIRENRPKTGPNSNEPGSARAANLPNVRKSERNKHEKEGGGRPKKIRLCPKNR